MARLGQASTPNNMKNNRHNSNTRKPPTTAKVPVKQVKTPAKQAKASAKQIKAPAKRAKASAKQVKAPAKRHVRHRVTQRGKKLGASSKNETVIHMRLVDPDHQQVLPARKPQEFNSLPLPRDTQLFDPMLLPKDLRARKILEDGGWFTELEIERWRKMKNKRTPWTSPTLATKFNIQRAREHANRALTEYPSMSLNAENIAPSPREQANRKIKPQNKVFIS